jgi:Phospholipase_D-nuclease N-terminal
VLFGASGFVFLFFFAFWVWALLDVIATDSEETRNLPKVLWLVIVVLLADIGAFAWVLLGRPPKGHWIARPTDFSASRRPVGVEDLPSYTSTGEITDRRSRELDRRLDAWEAEQRAKQSDPNRDPCGNGGNGAERDADA